MAVYSFQYSTNIQFSEKVQSHYFLLRCLPPSTPTQNILRQQCIFTPTSHVNRGVDAYGNLIQYGVIDEPHNSFLFESNGVADLSEYKSAEILHPIYCYPSPLTQVMPEVEALAEGVSLPSQTAAKVTKLANQLRKVLMYEKGTTSVETTAQQVIKLGKGVCQDFSHVLIALCRYHGIPARYVSGFIAGEGQTHSWVDYYDDGHWYGYDPTNDCPVQTGYIKLAHGRDFGDCPIERGVFKGIAQQVLSVRLNVEQQQ